MTDRDAHNPSDEDSAHESFVRLFTRERKRIYGFTYSLVPNTADAEDVFQQVSVVLWRKYGEFDTSRDFFSWACGVVYFTVQNFRRTKGRQRLLFSDDLVKKLSDERVKWSRQESDRSVALDECLSMLKASDRNLLMQIYGAGASPGEIATELGRTVQTVYNRLSKIRRGLLECVSQKMAHRQPLKAPFMDEG